MDELSEAADSIDATTAVEFVDVDPEREVVQRNCTTSGSGRYFIRVRANGRLTDVMYTQTDNRSLSDAELVALVQRRPVGEVCELEFGEPRIPTPPVVVAVCTHDNPDGLLRLLGSLKDQTYPAFEVLVVDNAPHLGSTTTVVRNFVPRPGMVVRYVPEGRKGLSHARNTALREVVDRSTLICWIDDDEVAEPRWVESLVQSMRAVPEAWAASGFVLPAELRTEAQQLFEVYGGHTKGKAFSRAVLRDGVGDTDALLPLPPFGVGANMAVYRWVHDVIGPFDRFLGAGTAVMGGEDTLLFSQILLSRGTVLYAPTALTEHFHRRTIAELEKQFTGYGRGLSGYYVALLFWRPTVALRMIRSMGRGMRALKHAETLQRSDLGVALPRQLTDAKRRGFMAGGWLYLRARLGARV